MRRGLILAAIPFCIFIASLLKAEPRGDTFVTKVAENEGNTRAGFSVSCSSNEWTTVLAVRAIRRSFLVQSLSTATELVCLSTFTTSGYACSSSAPGVTLATRDTYNDNSEQAIYCRGQSGAAQTLKGFENYDSRD